VRRALAIFAASVAVGALIAASGNSSSGSYRVRAVFDNASFLIPGEDVKIAGVKVGTIDHLDLTPDNKAAVVLRIDDPAFRPFRSDATCHVGLQSLIGEQFVECTPMQARGPGVPPAPPLRQIKSGPGKGQYLLPVSQTVTPVNQDLVNNILRMPERERLRLVINELGAGLAGNGSELRAALRRANPALQQIDQVVAVLARQDKLLARLVDESDRVLSPLAKRRQALGRFIRNSALTAQATAAQGDALERNLRKLPAFLKVLGPTADDFSALADQMTPALGQLNSNADAINKTVQRLGPVEKAATPALVALGAPAAHATRTFPALEPTTRQLTSLARPLLPLSGDLGALSSSFDKTGGIENVMRFIYYYTNSLNGEDQLGHYIRSALQVSVCSGRVSRPAPGCESNFAKTSGASIAGSQNELLDYLMGTAATP
jgi:phospholipid/cholesterol/gamma-HCH transport system substrate-binding protein